MDQRTLIRQEYGRSPQERAGWNGLLDSRPDIGLAICDLHTERSLIAHFDEHATGVYGDMANRAAIARGNAEEAITFVKPHRVFGLRQRGRGGLDWGGLT